MNELMNRLNLMDCMEGMGHFPDKYFDLAIVDPPYGLEGFKRKRHGTSRIDKVEKILRWDIKPDQNYFNELFRVSKKQIIWGANNFKLPESEYFIVWDKEQTVDNFATAEYAWTNCNKPAKIYRYSIHNLMQERKREGGKIHPTQKPVSLYKWLLTNYANPGDKILDTHVGSGSSLIACWEEGFEYCGFELDEDYYKAACNRIEQVQAQGKLFATV
jgi:site-specific DNA-methyltransferase (adenine-specific)